MPSIQIPTTSIGQNSTCFMGSTAQTSLSYIKATFTYPQQSAAYPLRGSYTNPSYYFWLYVYSNNSSYGSVAITYPWSEGPNASVGGNAQAFTGVYSYITIIAYPSYGRFFSYWSASYPGGAVVSYSNPYNLSYTDPYQGASIYANLY